MKKINIILLLMITSLFLYSCSDAYDIIQDGETDEQTMFQNVSDIRGYLDGEVYGSLDNTAEISLSSYFTDELGIGVDNTGQQQTFHRFFLDRDNDYAASIWAGYYSTIGKVNRLLKYAENVTPNAAEQAEYNSILAEARILRAYAYVQLESYFSTDMKDPNALGVLNFTTFTTLNAHLELPRVANSEIYQTIDADLAYADANFVSGSDYKYVTKNMLNALKARYYLYKGDYVLAKQFAQLTITSSGLQLTKATPYNASNFYGTGTTNPYRLMWNDTNQGEVIFALSRPASGGSGGIASLFYTNQTNLSGSVQFDMGRNLFNQLYPLNNWPDTNYWDIRAYAFVDPSSSIDNNYLTTFDYVSSDVICVDKYPGKGPNSGAVLRNDLKIFRLSEMYFILAECAAHDNNLTQVATYIKNIRDARSRLGARPLPVYANQTDAYADILKERRLEFCFEGYRYLDIKRLGVLANQSIDRNVTDDRSKTLPTTISNTDYRFTLPIPLQEIQGNPQVANQQNPGY